MLHIRRVNGPEWADELYDIQAKCLPVDLPCSVDAGWWWIAFDDDTPIAFGCLAHSHRFDGCGYLARAGTLLGYRGRGLQKRLIRVRVAWARRLGYTHLFTDTCDNAPSSNALIACGFRLYQPAKPYGLDRALYWRKAL